MVLAPLRRPAACSCSNDCGLTSRFTIPSFRETCNSTTWSHIVPGYVKGPSACCLAAITIRYKHIAGITDTASRRCTPHKLNVDRSNHPLLYAAKCVVRWHTIHRSVEALPWRNMLASGLLKSSFNNDNDNNNINSRHLTSAFGAHSTRYGPSLCPQSRKPYDFRALGAKRRDQWIFCSRFGKPRKHCKVEPSAALQQAPRFEG